VFNFIFYAYISVPHTYNYLVPQSSSEFPTPIQPKRPGRCSNDSQTRAPTVLVDGQKNNRADIEYPFEHGEVISYTLNGVSIHPVTTTIQVSFQTQLLERKESTQGFHSEAKGDFKPVTEFNGCDRRKLRRDQHCCYCTTLT
jgi:hypothetical protein